MKVKLLIIFTLSVFTTFQSCKKSPLTIGKTITETRALPDFKEVRLNDNINMSLVRSDKNCIKITTGENIIDNITTEVRDSVLTICNTTTFDWTLPYNYELHTTLYYKDIRNFIFNSSGNLDTKNQYNSDDTIKLMYRFEVDGGSGDVDILVNNCPYFYFVYQYGTSYAKIHGTNNKFLKIYKQSYGILDVKDFEAENVNVKNYYVGDCFVNVSDSLSAEIYHFGNVFYKGKPHFINCEYGEFAKGRLLPL